MAKQERKQFGKLPPQYNFIMNPYPDQRLTSCPQCGAKTGQRKRPLLIHIDPHQPVALNYTCRYCKQCDLLIAHKHEIEHLLTEMMRSQAPALIGNNYFIFGTVEKQGWQAGMTVQKPINEMMDYIHDFKDHYDELRVTETGWFAPGQKPGIRKPPPSREWVKQA
ncbi:MAG: hypothetical protein KDE19_06425 [Caldilineaceae bacterium]|nr:hypothetical protein [Caldilineaceae bacterium]